MEIPFTASQFLEVFRQYNTAVFPVQFLFILLAVMAIILAVRQSTNSGRVIAAILGLLWLWMGLIYHWGFFSDINKVAYVFGAMFMAQGALFLVKGVLHDELKFSHKPTPAVWMGSAMMLYSLLIYPLLGYMMGHGYPNSPTFGLPCPTTIFTLGILLWLDKKPPVSLLVVPLLWSLIGTVAAIKLGIREDVGLLASGALTLWFLVRKKPI